VTISPPSEGEFGPFYAGYIARVGDGGPLTMLASQVAAFEALRGLPETTGDFRYADGKWTVKELLGHMADAERVFAYRLLRIARADKTPLAGFDENAWAQTAPHARRTMSSIVDEMIAVRRSTLALVGSLDETSIGNTGVANNNPVSARAICWIMAGHTKHHLDILAERYGVKY
jgi:uncharacterized damage-inducible protein DinB